MPISAAVNRPSVHVISTKEGTEGSKISNKGGFLNCRLSSTNCRLNLQHEVDPVTPIHRKFLGASDLRELFLIIDPTAQGVLSGPRWHVRGDGWSIRVAL